MGFHHGTNVVHDIRHEPIAHRQIDRNRHLSVEPQFSKGADRFDDERRILGFLISARVAALHQHGDVGAHRAAQNSPCFREDEHLGRAGEVLERQSREFTMMPSSRI